MHNGISRLYETFGNAGADTVERKLQPNDYARTWYKQNPPLPKAMWSQRNNNNYTQTGLLTALSYFADNNKLFLKNFYLKSKRSILKPTVEGPAAYVLPGRRSAAGRAGRDAARAPAAGRRDFARDGALHGDAAGEEGAAARRGGRPASKPGDKPAEAAAKPGDQKPDKPKAEEKPKTETKQFPAGSYIVRMDQPYSRIADALLDYQYWSPNDPQKRPYDDTGWTFGELFNVQVVRVTDAKVLDAAMERVSRDHRAVGHQGDGRGLHRQQRRRPVAAGVPVPAEGRGLRRGRGAVRGRRAEVQPRVVHHPERPGCRRAGRRARARPPGLRRRVGADGEGAPRQDAAHRLHPHLARHAGRGLVADGVRPPQDPVRLHQHAGGGRRRPT